MNRKLDALVAERVLGRRVGLDSFSVESDDVPRYSTSLDAIWPVAVERAASGTISVWWRDHELSVRFVADIDDEDRCWGVAEQCYNTWPEARPALVLCIALLRAHGVSEDEIEEALR